MKTGTFVTNPNLVALPIIALVVAALVVAAELGAVALRKGDAYAIERQGDVLTRALAAHAEQLGRQQIPQVFWDEAVEKVRAGDLVWMDENYGPYLTDVFDIRQSYVLDGADQPVYGAIDGIEVAAEEYGRIAPVVDRWVDEIRAYKPEGKTATGLIAETKVFPDGRTAPFVVTARLDSIEGKPSVITVSTILPETDLDVLEGKPPPLLVSVAAIDEATLATIARDYGYAGLKWGENTAAGRVTRELRNDLGAPIGTLSFIPERPAELFIEELKPALAISLGVLALFAAGAIFLARRFALALASARERGWEASHDPLTGLPNRRHFVDALKRAFRAHEEDGLPLALISVDLDRFKELNDGFGHTAGDQALRLSADRIAAAVGGEHLVARMGGDEFQAVVAGADVADLPAMARRIIERAGQPMDLAGGIEARLGCSIGIAIADGDEVNDLVRQADLAMSDAKSEGRNRFQYFNPAMDERLRQRMDIERELATAIRSNHLSVAYQPIFASITGAPIGAEALVRWRHPTRGLISPSYFMPIAERTAAVAEIGDLVLSSACRDAAHWGSLAVSVNVSALQVLNFDIVDRVRAALETHGLAPERLELELTETALVQNEDRAASTIAALRDLGIGVALDDVGTGYSSLSHIRRFAFSRLKIDKSLVADVGIKPGASEIVVSIVGIARALGMSVTAEGIETATQKHFLEAAGCQALQGFFFSRDVTADEVARLAGGEPAVRRA